jgi:hypothetical protein
MDIIFNSENINIDNHTHCSTGSYDNSHYPENIYESPKAPIIYNDNQEEEFYLPFASDDGHYSYPSEYTDTRHNTNTHYDSYGFPQANPIAEYKPTTSFESPFLSQTNPQSIVHVDSYGSPRAPVLHKDNIGYLHSYPNALHEISVTDDFTHNDIIFVNSDDGHTNNQQYDIYGYPQANIISDLPDIISGTSGPTSEGFTHKETDLDNSPEFPLVIDNANFLDENVIGMTTNSIASNGIVQAENSELDQSNIPQKPSVGFPDQENPEKYLNNDQETLDKVINTPVFYNDTQQFKKNISPQPVYLFQ